MNVVLKQNQTIFDTQLNIIKKFLTKGTFLFIVLNPFYQLIKFLNHHFLISSHFPTL